MFNVYLQMVINAFLCLETHQIVCLGWFMHSVCVSMCECVWFRISKQMARRVEMIWRAIRTVLPLKQ